MITPRIVFVMVGLLLASAGMLLIPEATNPEGPAPIIEGITSIAEIALAFTLSVDASRIDLRTLR